MRSTRATAAVERLKTRSGNKQYSMVRTASEQFYLICGAEKLSADLALDDFVKFVNAFGPQTPRRITKSDAAFEKQLTPKNK